MIRQTALNQTKEKREVRTQGVSRVFLRNTCALILCVLVVLCVSGPLWANVNINLVAVNGSEEKKDYPIHYDLPRELTPEDIVNAGKLNIDYDINKEVYFVHGTVELGPKESKTVKIEVKDVWMIDPEEIEVLKKQIEDNVKFLEGTKYYAAAEILGNDMTGRLDYIVGQQKTFTDNVARRIEEYRSHRAILNEIRKNAFSSDYFQSTYEPEEITDTVTFYVEVENPSEEKEQEVEQKHYLPGEILSEHIIDAQGFEVRYDEERQQSFLKKGETFKPGEKKRYAIVMKDIWHIEEGRVDSLRGRAERVFEQLQDSDYRENAGYIFDKIITAIEKVEMTKVSKSNMAQYIGTYRVNIHRLGRAERDIERLEKLLAFIKAKKLKEMEKSSVKNILQKLQSLRGIAAISKAIFGKKPSVNTTWRIIWGVMVFIAIFTTIHFLTWWRRSRLMGEEGATPGGGMTEISESTETSVEEAGGKQGG